MGLCEGLGQIFDGMVYSNDILGYTLKYFTLNERSEFTLLVNKHSNNFFANGESLQTSC